MPDAKQTEQFQTVVVGGATIPRLMTPRELSTVQGFPDFATHGELLPERNWVLKVLDGGRALYPIIRVDGKVRPAHGSDGNPICSDEGDLLNFWRWFGDSQAVDAFGRPLVLYHGTESDDFGHFDSSRNGSASGSAGFLGQGFYFTDKRHVAGHYGTKIVVSFLKMDNPAVLSGDLKNDAREFGLLDLHPKGAAHSLGEILSVADHIRSGMGKYELLPRGFLIDAFVEFEGREYAIRSMNEEESKNAEHVKNRLVSCILHERFSMPDIENLGVAGHAVGSASLSRQLILNGYDGVISDGTDLFGIGSKEYVVFDPGQIHIARANQVNDDSNEPAAPGM